MNQIYQNMEKVKAVHLRMPRCGSTTLGKWSDDNKIKSYGGVHFGFRERYDGKDKGITNNPLHKSLSKCVISYMGLENYLDHFLFSSIRNPFDRALSIYRHKSWNSVDKFSDFCYALKHNDFPNSSAQWHSVVLSDHLYSGSGRLLVDKLIRLESFNTDFNDLCEVLQLPKSLLKHMNVSKNKPPTHYRDFYKNKERTIIEEYYGDDLFNFNYKF